MQRDNLAEYHILLARVPEPLEEIHARLENWAAWSRDRIRKGHCASFEGRYRSPQIWEAEEPRLTFDVLDALEVFRAVTGMPDDPRWLLHLWYVHKAPEGYVRRKLAIHRTALVEEINKARRMAKNRLTV